MTRYVADQMMNGRSGRGADGERMVMNGRSGRGAESGRCVGEANSLGAP